MGVERRYSNLQATFVSNNARLAILCIFSHGRYYSDDSTHVKQVKSICAKSNN